MAHRAGTGDQPIPGLVTSRRNPAYKQRLQKQKEAEAAAEAQRKAELARVKAAKQLQKSQKQRRSPSRSPKERETSVERRSREKEEAEAKARRAQKDAEERRRREAEEAENRRRWQEQEAKWAEERRARDEQKRLEEERKAARQQKLKGAFAMADDDHDDEEHRKKELEKKARSRQGVQIKLATTSVSSAVASTAAKGQTADDQDAISLRAALADPSGPRNHAPGEVAEHFRRLSEMKRRFRRTEFGGPRKRTPSRSRSRKKYNSVWIRDERSRSRGRS